MPCHYAEDKSFGGAARLPDVRRDRVTDGRSAASSMKRATRNVSRMRKCVICEPLCAEYIDLFVFIRMLTLIRAK